MTYGVVWAIVVAISPWQTSRYLMAKNEHVVMRSAIFASMGVIAVTIALYFSAAFVYSINPHLEDSSTSIIWASMNLMPTIIGIVILTGILSAGISSASTFLSLIGFSLTNDMMRTKNETDNKKILKISRLGMGIASVVIFLVAYLNPPEIFLIMYFGGTVIASSWGLVAIASIWSKRLSELGAFLGMLFGFLGCVIPKALSAWFAIEFPVYLDPFFIGVVASAVGMICGSIIAKPTSEETCYFKMIHSRNPDESVIEAKKTHSLAYVYIAFGLCLGLFFIFFYALPYTQAIA